jgi:hypothetical protein
MRMKDGAPSGEQEILTDLPIACIRVKGHGPPNDFDRDGEALFVNFGSQLVEVEKMFVAEDHHTPVGPHRAEVGETGSLSDEDPSFRNNLFGELRGFRKDIVRTEKTSLWFHCHLGEVKFAFCGKPPGDDPAPPFCQRIDPDLCGY